MLKKIRTNVTMHRPPAPVFLLILIVLAVSAWLIIQSRSGPGSALTASGSIEGVTVKLAPEIAGQVDEVLVEEGQAVREGEPVLRLDPSLLAAQRAVAAAGVDAAKSAAQTAQAAYESAQIQYDITLTAARAADSQMRIADWIGKRPDYFAQPTWYFTRAEQIAAAEAEVQAAEAGLQEAQAALDEALKQAGGADLLAAEQHLSQARTAYLITKDLSARAQLSEQDIRPEDVPLRCPPWIDCYRIKIAAAKKISGQDEDLLDAAQDAHDVAKAELENAQRVYDALLSTQAARDVQKARASVALATERLALAQDRLSMLRTGEQSPQVAAAAKAVEQARAALLQAQEAIRQAEANLALLDTQISKLELRAPSEGIILNRNVEPGEFVQPGTNALELVRLDSLTITVYVPEDRYGQISLGQKVTVTADSFPGETFEATVIYISDRAEFTPRNVQTVEGRSTTVYAIKLRLDDPGGKLKPGMPADVIFR